MSAYKFQVFIPLNRNSLSLPKVLYDAIQINNISNLMDKDIFIFGKQCIPCISLEYKLL